MAKKEPLTPQKKKMMLFALVFLAVFVFLNRWNHQMNYNQKLEAESVAQEDSQTTRVEESQSSNQIDQELQDISWGQDMVNTENQDNQAAKEDSVLQALTDNFQGLATVEFSKEAKSFSVLPISEEMKAAILQAYQEPELAKEGWSSMVENFRIASETYAAILGEGYSLHLLNPENTENSLVTVSDGQVTYDALGQ